MLGLVVDGRNGDYGNLEWRAMTQAEDLKNVLWRLRAEKKAKFNRRVSIGDLLAERDELAEFYGWGKGTTCYDNVLVLGDVRIGKNTWIGPNVVLDGSSGLTIGDNCTICAGVQIYTHDSVKWALSGGQHPYELSPTSIGSNCFIGPNAVIARGVTIGDRVAVGACTFVNKSIETGGKFTGAVISALPKPRSQDKEQP